MVAGIQKTLSYSQINKGSLDQIFPLLCPVREVDWLDGWSYEMVHSKSGLIEENCVFMTSNPDGSNTIWHVVKHDPLNHKIVFVRVHPNENVVRIDISLSPLSSQTTRVDIDYQYTGLNQQQNEFITNNLESSFRASMQWWEKAINHYLQTGQKLRK